MPGLALAAFPPLDAIHVTPLPQQQLITPLRVAKPSNDPMIEAITARLHTLLTTVQRQNHQAKSTTRRRLPAVPSTRRQPNNLEIQRRSNGTPRQIKGDMLTPAVSSSLRTRKAQHETTAHHFLRTHRTLLGIQTPDKEFKLMRHTTDTLGRHHLRFQLCH